MVGSIASAWKTCPFFKTSMVNYAWRFVFTNLSPQEHWDLLLSLITLHVTKLGLEKLMKLAMKKVDKVGPYWGLNAWELGWSLIWPQTLYKNTLNFQSNVYKHLTIDSPLYQHKMWSLNSCSVLIEIICITLFRSITIICGTVILNVRNIPQNITSPTKHYYGLE